MSNRIQSLIESIPDASPLVGVIEYKQAWQDTLGANGLTDPFEMALMGGLLADRLSWVFAGAYQAAQHGCFPALSRLGDWYSFAISEDRGRLFPGTTITDGFLTGYKTWVAGGPMVDHIIVTIGPAIAGGCYLVPADHERVTIVEKPPGDFLSELPQDRVTFTGVPMGDTTELDHSHAVHFGLAEPYFVMVAGCGYLSRQSARIRSANVEVEAMEEINAGVYGVLEDLESLGQSGFWSDVPGLIECQQAVTHYGRRLAALVNAGDAAAVDAILAEDWALNGKLLGMYGRGLRARLE